jgi:SAM-dependent methyltransferase
LSGLDVELQRMKERTRAAWASGEYAAIARRNIWEVGERIVRAVGVRTGEDVLDVACGTGNAATRAAGVGARVSGVDLTPELFDAGRAEAAAAGVELEWVEGDAEALPFADESFDVVVSVFGCMFAPRHEVTAHELARVLRPGGRLGICSWTPEGSVGRMFQVTSRYLPPLPEVAKPPILWGSEEHVRTLFAGSGIELELKRDGVRFPPFESAEAEVEFYTRKLGPAATARRLTEENGRWPSLRDDMASLHAPGGEVAEYLQVVGTKPGRLSRIA